MTTATMAAPKTTPKVESPYSYRAALAASERINWRVEDLIGGDKRLDFRKPFMPEALARVEKLDFLSPVEKRTLNQIRGLEYLYLFGLVEEFILPFVLDHARPQLHQDHYLVRAFLEFASEEAKHIHLFRRFKEEFEAGFGTPVQVIGPPEAVAQAVLAKPALSVAMVILHIEWMTQRHWTESAQDDGGMDPQFKSLLKHHWMEEAQHAKLDTLMVGALAEGKSEAEILKAVEGYFEIGGILDGGLTQQRAFNLEAFTRATGRVLSAAEREAYERIQQQGQRWTFLGSGMTHPNFVGTLGQLSAAARAKVEQVSPMFS